MNLNNRGAWDPRLKLNVENSLAAFDNVEFELLDMKRRLDNADDWDWKTDTTSGDTTPQVLFRTDRAQMQVFRFTLTMDGPVGSVDQYRTVRFTFDHRVQPDLRISAGMAIRVVSCPGNPTNESYVYIVNSGLNSGSPFRRTIEAEVDMRRIWPS